MSFSRVLLCAAVGLVLHAESAKADLLFNNIEETRSSSTGVDTGRLAQKFTTGNTGNNYSLNSISVLIGYQGGALLNNPTLQIYSSDGNTPDSPVHTLTMTGTVPGPTSGSPGYGNVTFTSTGFALVNNTSYWAVLSFLGAPGTNSASGTNKVRWGQVASNNYTGTFGAVGTWVSQDMSSWSSNQSSNPLMMKVDATAQTNAVPEPASFVMMGLGLGGMGIVRRLRRKA